MSPNEFHIDDDDLPVGRILSRREAVRLLGLTAGSLFVAGGCSDDDATGIDDDTSGTSSGNITTCTAKPQLTEGPYYVDTALNRADIRSNAASGALRTGIPLALNFTINRINGGACTPIQNAVVDVWHCDALGAYSGVNDPQFGNLVGQTWLRGYQLTSASGQASFTTIFPGWYQGRATHIHFNVRTAASGATSYDFTSQLFFQEALLTQIYTTVAPYTQRGDAGRLRNASDGIYRQGGSQLLLNPSASGDGYAASVVIGLVT
jgi:protocatechuate 3,4-dioxygenase beta subunit